MKKAMRVFRFQTNFDHNQTPEFSGISLKDQKILRTYTDGWLVDFFGEKIFLRNHNRNITITKSQALTCEWCYSCIANITI